MARDRDALGQVRPELSRRAQPRSDTALADYPPLATRPSASPAAGSAPITLGYYDTDAAASITRGTTTTTLSLDAAGRRHKQTTGTTVVKNGYVEDSDNPGFSTTTTGAGEPVVSRYINALGGDLAVRIEGSSATLSLANPHGDVFGEVNITTAGTVSAGMSGWTTYDEYGNATRLSASTVGNMYRWHGADQRAVLAAGLILMGVRLYNPVTGHFTTRDPVPGGNSTMYAYPQDPLNSDDLDGLAARYGGLYILYIGRTPVYVGQSINIRSRVLRHFRKPHLLRVTHVAVKSIPRHRGESYKSYKRRFSVAEQRVMNNLRARGYKLPFNSINAHWRGRMLGNGGSSTLSVVGP